MVRSVLDSVDLAVKARPVTLRQFLIQNRGRITGQIAESLQAGGSQRVFFEILADQCAKAGIVSQAGAVSGLIVDRLWRRINEKAPGANIAAMPGAQSGPSAPAPQFIGVGRRKSGK